MILIRNLKHSTTLEDVGTLFGKFKPLTETNLPIDHLTGERKALTFVTYTTPTHAAAAISALEIKGFQGQRLHMTLTRAMTTPRRTHQRHAKNTATEPEGNTKTLKENLDHNQAKNLNITIM